MNVKFFKINIILIILFSFSVNLFAQEEPQIIEVTGKIVDISTKEIVEFAHLINLQKHYASVSDTSGYFRILMTETDSIRVSCIGYEVKYWSLRNKPVSDNSYNTVMYLIPRTYQLSEVSIYKIRWDAFEYDVAHTKVEKDVKQQQLQIWFDNMISDGDLKALYTVSRGVGFSIPFKTRQERQFRKLKKLKRETELNELAYQKYNKELVNNITKLEDEELENFMDYCRFERQFILNTSEYDLIVIISEIYDIYKIEMNK